MPKYRSEIFRVIEEYSEKSFEYDPIGATYAGKKLFNDSWNDYTYQPVDPFLRVAKATRNKLMRLEAVDYADEIAKKVILENLDRYINDDDTLFYYTYWGGHFHPLEDVATVFGVMPHKTPKDIANIVSRMEKIPKITLEWISALKDLSKLNCVNSYNRTLWAIDSIEAHARGGFTDVARTVAFKNKKLMQAAIEAEIAFEQTAAWLRVFYLPMTIKKDAIGEKRYRAAVQSFTGLDVDPREVYEYGLSEIERINKEMWEVARELKPDATSLVEVAEWLNAHERYTVRGVVELKKTLESITAKAIKDLNGKYFTLPVEIKKCEVVVDETTIDESPYYMQPSDDLERPGRTIYPAMGREVFTIWENYSTWFHESVPGHHMQLATAVLNKETLTTYQRGEGWNSGYGEGWALYSERLMDELGYFKDPGHKMGYLMCQAMRAARCVVDVGLHLEYEDENGEVWNYDSATRFMVEKALLKQSYAENEIKRYISWAGQAVSYKLGEKVWLEAREDARAKYGDKFNLKKWHMFALGLGPMGLDMLREELGKF